MKSMEDLRAIEQQFRNQQEKFVYYIIALSIAAIGFSIHLTYGQPFKWSQLFLGFSIMSYGISILCGFKYLKILLEVLSLNRKYLDQKYSGLLNENETDIFENVEIKQKKAPRLWNCQYRLFFLGVILFLIWHLTEMYLTSVNI